MNAIRLQALLEFDQGVFHAFQCERYKSVPDQHKAMSEAQDWLVEHEMIRCIGEEFFLTEYGKDVRDTAVHAAAKYQSDWEGL